MNFIKDLDKEYDNYNENFAEGSDDIREAYNALHNSFEAYLTAVEEHEWKAGFNHAVRLMLGGGVK